MGFALWIDGDTAWAQGTHEYRPMGVGVIGVSTLFSPRDFHRKRLAPGRMHPTFAGFFASLGDVNNYLEKRRIPKGRSQHSKKKLGRPLTQSVPEF